MHCLQASAAVPGTERLHWLRSASELERSQSALYVLRLFAHHARTQPIRSGAQGS